MSNDPPNPPSRWSIAFDRVVAFIPTIMTILLIVIVLIFVGVIIYAIFKVDVEGGFLRALEQIEFARGLITFLIAIATVAIAIILALSAIISGGTEQEQKERFGRGKEVLAVLVGVLGTIVGFYFGAEKGSQSNANRGNSNVSQTQGPQITAANFSNEQPKRGDTISITSFVTGGKSPYTYSITFDPNISPGAIKDVLSQDGIIKQDIAIPSTIAIEKDTPVKFQIEVKDGEGKSATYNKDGARRLTLKP